MKLSDVQHHFQSWVLWTLERTATLHVQNPYFLRVKFIMNQKRSQKQKHLRLLSESGQNSHCRLITLCWAFKYQPRLLFLFFCHWSGSPTVPQSSGSVREDAARFPAAGQRRHRRVSICPWARAKGRGLMPLASRGGDYSPYTCPCHSQIWKSHSGILTSRTFPITHGKLQLCAWRARSCLKSSVYVSWRWEFRCFWTRWSHKNV